MKQVFYLFLYVTVLLVLREPFTFTPHMQQTPMFSMMKDWLYSLNCSAIIDQIEKLKKLSDLHRLIIMEQNGNIIYSVLIDFNEAKLYEFAFCSGNMSYTIPNNVIDMTLNDMQKIKNFIAKTNIQNIETAYYDGTSNNATISWVFTLEYNDGNNVLLAILGTFDNNIPNELNEFKNKIMDFVQKKFESD